MVSLYSFADDNTLSEFATIISELNALLETESEIIINQLQKNKVIVNPDKSQAIILDKRKTDHANERVNIDNEQMKVV